MIGQITLFGGGHVPQHHLPCDGRRLKIAEFPELCRVLGFAFGGDGQNDFALPDLRGRMALGSGPGHPLGQEGGAETTHLTASQIPTHQHRLQLARPGSATSPHGGLLTDEWITAAGGGATLAPGSIGLGGAGVPHENMPPFLAVQYLIQVREWDYFADPFYGEMRLWGGARPPEGWLLCDGRALKVQDHQALYSLVGVTFAPSEADRYDRTRFWLPNLQARFARANGGGFAGLGQQGGAKEVKLEARHLPAHGHPLFAGSGGAAVPPAGKFVATGGAPFGTQDGGQQLDAVEAAGGGQAHDNLPPYLALHYIICASGNFPELD